jgi:hypothetical protein
MEDHSTTLSPDAKTTFYPESLRVADAISRHDFDLREWRILEFIRKLSFSVGRPAAHVPSLRYFELGTRITRGNVCTILRRLKACIVIQEEPQWYYGFLLLPPPADPAANWRVPMRTEEVEVIRQMELLEMPPNLNGALRDAFVDSCRGRNTPGSGPDSYSRPGGDGGERLTNTYAGVPESGTVVVQTSRSRIGNGSFEPTFTGSPATVPDSGTPNVPMQHCKNALTKEHSYNVTMCVPESGTGCGFTQEQQEVFDALGKCGAFGPHNESRGCWFTMVKLRCSVTNRLLAELKYALMTRKVRKPGAWMMDLWKRWDKPDV